MEDLQRLLALAYDRRTTRPLYSAVNEIMRQLEHNPRLNISNLKILQAVIRLELQNSNMDDYLKSSNSRLFHHTNDVYGDHNGRDRYDIVVVKVRENLQMLPQNLSHHQPPDSPTQTSDRNIPDNSIGLFTFDSISALKGMCQGRAYTSIDIVQGHTIIHNQSSDSQLIHQSTCILSQYIVPQHEHAAIIDDRQSITSIPSKLITYNCIFSPREMVYGVSLIFYRVIDMQLLVDYMDSEIVSDSPSYDKGVSLGGDGWTFGQSWRRIKDGYLQSVNRIMSQDQTTNTTADSSSYEKGYVPRRLCTMESARPWEHCSIDELLAFLHRHRDGHSRSMNGYRSVALAHGMSLCSSNKEDIWKMRHALSCVGMSIAQANNMSMHGKDAEETDHQDVQANTDDYYADGYEAIFDDSVPDRKTLEEAKTVLDLLIERLNEYNPSSFLDEDFLDRVLHQYLPLHIIATIIIAMIFEWNVIISSSCHGSVLPMLCDWFLDAIKPLEYCHLYSPTIPRSMLIDILTCPTPFFLGFYGDLRDLIHIDDVFENQSRLLIVDIDTWTISASESHDSSYGSIIHALYTRLMVELPWQVSNHMPSSSSDTRMPSHLASYVHHSDSIDVRSRFNHHSDVNKDRRASDVCKEFIFEYFLKHIPAATWIVPSMEATSSPSKVFNETIYRQLGMNYLQSRDRTDKEFHGIISPLPAVINQLIKTQLFSNYLATI